MREPKRIKEFCEQLAATWERVPDWRFGQFISNVLGQIQSDKHRDIFFIEDEEMLQGIRKYFKIEDGTPLTGNKKISIPFDETHVIVAEAYNAGGNNQEITIYLEETATKIVDQDIALVRKEMQSKSDTPTGCTEVLVWGDHEQEDYTDRFSIKKYQGEM